MDTKTYAFVRDTFNKYYSRRTFSSSRGIEREWAYIPFNYQGGTQMERHISLDEYDNDVNNLFDTIVPQHMYRSAAKYAYPGKTNTSEKNETGVDLVFDIDGDEVTDGGFVNRINTARDEMEKLYDIVTNDLGFQETQLYFSGGKGFHLHILDSEIQQLSSDSRDELAEYVIGESLDATDFITQERKFTANSGWGRRIEEVAFDKFNNMGKDKLLTYIRDVDGISEEKSNKLYQDIKDYPEVNSISSEMETYICSLENKVRDEYGVKIDKPVTTDIYRLIRFPYSLHGGTGLQVTPLSIDNLSEFSPTDAIPESENEVDILCEDEINMSVGSQTIQANKGDTITVGEFIAIHLVLMQKAKYLGRK